MREAHHQDPSNINCHDNVTMTTSITTATFKWIQQNATSGRHSFMYSLIYLFLYLFICLLQFLIQSLISCLIRLLINLLITY